MSYHGNAATAIHVDGSVFMFKLIDGSNKYTY